MKLFIEIRKAKPAAAPLKDEAADRPASAWGDQNLHDMPVPTARSSADLVSPMFVNMSN
jgi:hypothetical protein